MSMFVKHQAKLSDLSKLEGLQCSGDCKHKMSIVEHKGFFPKKKPVKWPHSKEGV